MYEGDLHPVNSRESPAEGTVIDLLVERYVELAVVDGAPGVND